MIVFLTKAREIIIKYWKLFLGTFLVLVGYFLGKRKNKTIEIEKKDLEAKIDYLTETTQKEKEIRNQHADDLSEAQNNLDKKIKKIKQIKKDQIDNLSNNNEKLDNILKDKFNLKKGK